MNLWQQKDIQLRPLPRGFHLITREIENRVDQIRQYSIGLAHIFLRHTSASLTLNENACADVRTDFEEHFNRLAPENAPYYQHTHEGPDDMPAHLKSSLLGQSLSIPLRDGRLHLGTWQGIYLCEHRDVSSFRTLTITLQGETYP